MNALAIVLCSALAAPLADSRSNDVPAPVATAKARDLIKQLGDSRFKVREAAEKEILAMGIASLDALKEGEKHPDLHIQERCRLLQPAIQGIVLQKRINSFLALREGPLPADMPFAGNFIKITGDSKEARKLYAEVLLINPILLDTAHRDKAKGMELFTTYCQDMQNRVRYVPGTDYRERQKAITQADVALYLLLTSELGQDRTGRLGSFGYTFLNAPALPETLAKEEPATLPFRKLFLTWIEKEPQPYIAQRGLQIAADAKMKETLPLVLKMMKEKNSNIYSRAQIALLLSRVGTQEHIKEMEILLDDKTHVGTVGINNKQARVEMRDVALAVCIKLSGQKMADYPFDVMQGADSNLHMSYVYCAFSEEAKRDEAHKKYKEWQAKTAKEKEKDKAPKK